MSEIHANLSAEPSKISDRILDTTLYRNDPHSLLPSNSEPLSSHIVRILTEVELYIEEEKRESQKIQKQVAIWEERIRGNYFQMGKNVDQIKMNQIDATHELLHRDYWWGRENLVFTDFTLAKNVGRSSDWAWVINKYGLTNSDGTPLDPHARCIEELCLGAIRNLAIEYKEAGVRYDLAHNYKRAESDHLTSINTKLSATNEHLRNYINNVQNIRTSIHDGILFLMEFGLKVKSLQTDETPATFGDLRAWSEEHLDQFLKKYPSIPQRVVSVFRRLASIPLPAQNS